MEVYVLFAVTWLIVILMKSRRSIGWVNFYRTKSGKIMISCIPKDSEEEALARGRLNEAESEYIGTFKIYK